MNIVIGMDLGDKRHVVVVLDKNGKEVKSAGIGNTEKQVMKFFRKYPGSTVIMEAGTHSPWVSRLLQKLGHEVYVSNPRKVRAIYDADDKTDERDARTLAYIYRFEPRLLYSISHRGEEAQRDLVVIKARNQLVQSRSQLINHCRSIVKSFGLRISKCSAEAFYKRAREEAPKELTAVLDEVLITIENINKQIKVMDLKIDKFCEDKYPETEYLRQIKGVGAVTALAFILTIEAPEQFKKSRSVGAFLGLIPKKDQSGDTDKQLSITKAGNKYLRQLLVNCSNYILGPFGEDCELKRYGLRISARGGKIAKKKANTAVARKLSVLLHRLWLDKSTYDPFYRCSRKKVA